MNLWVATAAVQAREIPAAYTAGINLSKLLT